MKKRILFFILLVSVLAIAFSGCGAKKYKVTFDPNGGELVSGSLTQTVKEGESAEAPEDAAELIPPLKLSCAYPNDLRRMDMAFSVQSGEAWKTAFAAHVTVEDQADLPEFPGAEGRTVLSPNRFGSYTDAGYQNELRTVAVPYLNRLVLTKLPRDARPLMTTLLVLVSQLGQ